MKGHPATSTTTGHTEKGGEDPWMALLDQLWQANPYSTLVPLDPVEITRAFLHQASHHRPPRLPRL
jgi:hypothetical protein